MEKKTNRERFAEVKGKNQTEKLKTLGVMDLFLVYTKTKTGKNILFKCTCYQEAYAFAALNASKHPTGIQIKKVFAKKIKRK